MASSLSSAQHDVQQSTSALQQLLSTNTRATRTEENSGATDAELASAVQRCVLAAPLGSRAKHAEPHSARSQFSVIPTQCSSPAEALQRAHAQRMAQSDQHQIHQRESCSDEDEAARAWPPQPAAAPTRPARASQPAPPADIAPPPGGDGDDGFASAPSPRTQQQQRAGRLPATFVDQRSARRRTPPPATLALALDDGSGSSAATESLLDYVPAGCSTRSGRPDSTRSARRTVQEASTDLHARAQQREFKRTVREQQETLQARANAAPRLNRRSLAIAAALPTSSVERLYAIPAKQAHDDANASPGSKRRAEAPQLHSIDAAALRECTFTPQLSAHSRRLAAAKLGRAAPGSGAKAVVVSVHRPRGARPVPILPARGAAPPSPHREQSPEDPADITPQWQTVHDTVVPEEAAARLHADATSRRARWQQRKREIEAERDRELTFQPNVARAEQPSMPVRTSLPAPLQAGAPASPALGWDAAHAALAHTTAVNAVASVLVTIMPAGMPSAAAAQAADDAEAAYFECVQVADGLKPRVASIDQTWWTRLAEYHPELRPLQRSLGLPEHLQRAPAAGTALSHGVWRASPAGAARRPGAGWEPASPVLRTGSTAPRSATVAVHRTITTDEAARWADKQVRWQQRKEAKLAAARAAAAAEAEARLMEDMQHVKHRRSRSVDRGRAREAGQTRTASVRRRGRARSASPSRPDSSQAIKGIDEHINRQRRARAQAAERDAILRGACASRSEWVPSSTPPRSARTWYRNSAPRRHSQRSGRVSPGEAALALLDSVVPAPHTDVAGEESWLDQEGPAQYRGIGMEHAVELPARRSPGARIEQAHSPTARTLYSPAVVLPLMPTPQGMAVGCSIPVSRASRCSDASAADSMTQVQPVATAALQAGRTAPPASAAVPDFDHALAELNQLIEQEGLALQLEQAELPGASTQPAIQAELLPPSSPGEVEAEFGLSAPASPDEALDAPLQPVPEQAQPSRSRPSSNSTLRFKSLSLLKVKQAADSTAPQGVATHGDSAQLLHIQQRLDMAIAHS